MYTVKHYGDLFTWASSFSFGHFGLLIVVGKPGLSKSRVFSKAMVNHDDHLLMKAGNLTAFQFYKNLYHHKDQHVIIDDVESALKDRTVVRLLKTLCETEDERRIEWQSSSNQLVSEGIPRSFLTTSKVCIIVNEISTLSDHVESLVDRGHLLSFKPSPGETFRHAKTFFKDKEILDFVEAQLDYIDYLSLRVFVRARESKKANIDWQTETLQNLGIYHIRLVEGLLNDRRFSTNEQRIRAFMDETGYSRPVFHSTWEELNRIMEKNGRKPTQKRVVLGNTTSRRKVVMA